MAFGQGRDYVTMFVNIDLVAVGSWAERNNVVLRAATRSSPPTRRSTSMVDEAPRRGEPARSPQEPQMAASQIRRFLILHKELDADDGELTRTQKVRRDPPWPSAMRR